MIRRRFLAAVPVLLACLVAPREASARDLSFDERVKAQEAIERAYYSHQIGATKPFAEAVPREVLERKVRTYLKESRALEKYWGTPVTPDMLRRETERVAAQTRMPERLEQLYAALGRDSVLFQETVARAALADRLVRSFFAHDSSLRGRAGPEVDWDRWWRSVWGQFDETAVRSVATKFDLPNPSRAHAGDTFGHQAGKPPELPSALSGGTAEDAAVCAAPDTWQDGTLDHPTPQPRLGASSVWTGSLMLVWGGTDRIQDANSAAHNDGSRYDPATDTWTPISGLLAPAARFAQSAVWSGTELIIWGGQGYGDCSGSCFNYCETAHGGRYDPVSDTWKPMTTVNAPSPRHNHSAVWTGSSMIVWGGMALTFTIDPRTGLCSTHNNVYGDGRRYDPVSDTWSAVSTTNAPGARFDHGAVWTGDTMVVWGGQNFSSIFLTGGRYDPASDTWLPTSTLGAPEARTNGFSVIWNGAEMIVWGGDGSATQALATGGRYSPLSDTWMPLSVAGAPTGRRFHTAIWTGSVMVVWGGSNTSTDLGDGGRYDPVADSWSGTSLLGAPPPRSLHVAVWTGQRMIVWGGASVQGGRYDPVGDSWTPTQDAFTPRPRAGHQAVWTGNLVIVHGGEAGFLGEQVGADGGRYDPLLDTWTPTSTLNATGSASGFGMVWTGQQVIAWGGGNAGGQYVLGTGGRYDPISDTWQPISSNGAPSARVFTTAVWTGHVMVIWGGRESSLLPTNTGGRYDPATDTWTPTSLNGALPSARRSHTAVWTGNRMIIWGGGPNESGLTNTGALYDPVADVWTSATSINNAPSSRLGHTAVWTGNRMIVWGGLLDSFHNVTATGGTYDPASNSWQTLPLAGAPSARQEHMAAWTGQAMLIWGGEDDSMAPVSFFGDGARYDPASNAWSPLALAGAPQPRANSFATVTGDSMLVWGGINGTELQSGGRYCLCSASLFFADRDGDGRGDPSLAESACTAPAGFVPDGSDCEDANPSIWSKPSEVSALTLIDDTSLQWTVPAQTGGTSPAYDVVRTSNKADFLTGASCVATGASGTSTIDYEFPPIGAAFYYLVAARTGCADGQGPWGLNSQGQPIAVRTCP